MCAKPSRPLRGARSATKPDPRAFFTQAEIDAASSQAGNGNPVLVTDAFVIGAEPIKVAGFEIPPIGLGRYMILEKIASPMVRPGGADKMNNFQLAQLIFVCTKPEPLVRGLLAQGGSVFEDAVLVFADAIPMESIQSLGMAIGQRMAQAMSTIISSASSGGTGDAAAEKKTAGASPESRSAATG